MKINRDDYRMDDLESKKQPYVQQLDAISWGFVDGNTNVFVFVDTK